MTTNFVRPLHVLKVSSPIAVTVFGIVTLVMVLFSPKAKSLMEVTPSGITTSPPLPLYLVSTPFLIVKSPSAANAAKPAPGRNAASMTKISAIEMICFFMALSLFLS